MELGDGSITACKPQYVLVLRAILREVVGSEAVGRELVDHVLQLCIAPVALHVPSVELSFRRVRRRMQFGVVIGLATCSGSLCIARAARGGGVRRAVGSGVG